MNIPLSRMSPRDTRTSGSITAGTLVTLAIFFASIWQYSLGTSLTTATHRSANDFVQSLGVAAHLSAQDYPDSKKMATTLEYLGISHVRTNSAVTGGANDKGVQSATILGENGVKFNFTIPKPAGKQPDIAAVKKAVDARIDYITRNNLAAYTESIEPFNEYDNAGVKNWPVVLQQATLYMSSQRSRLAPDTKILGPALIGYNLKNTSSRYNAETGGLSASSFDYGNIHSYYGGAMPETAFADAPSTSGKQFNTAPDGQDSRNIEARLKYYATQISGDKPIVVTEMGYNNDRTDKQKHISEAAAGIYMPRAYLENFRIGVLRSYVYELFDEPHTQPSSEQHYGLFRADGSAKPAAKAIHNMTSLLAGGSVQAPTKLAYSLTGDTSDLRHVVLQKNDGEYYIALWRQRSVYDTKADKDIPQQASNVTVSSPGAATIKAFSNLSSDHMNETATHASSFDVAVGAEVILVAISR